MKGKRADGPPEDDLTRHSVMRTLYATLSQEDKAAAAEQLAGVVGRLDALEEEKKKANDEFNSRRKGFEAELSELAEKVSLGVAQEVPCTIERDYKAATIRVWRTDNDEMVEERAMTPEELQREIEFGRIPPVGAGDPVPAEGDAAAEAR